MRSAHPGTVRALLLACLLRHSKTYTKGHVIVDFFDLGTYNPHAYDAVRHPKNQWRDLAMTLYDKDKKRHVVKQSSRFAGFAANMNNTEFEFRGRLYRFENGQLHCVGMCEETNPQRFSIR